MEINTWNLCCLIVFYTMHKILDHVHLVFIEEEIKKCYEKKQIKESAK